MALGALCPQRLWGASSKYQLTDIRVPMAPDNPAVLFDAAKCVQCGQCKTVCERMMSVSGFYDLAKSGDVPVCVNCGQCTSVCEGLALVNRPEWQAVKAAKAAGKTVVVSISPSVRVGLAEEFGAAPGTFCEGEVVAALRALGADYVLDTCFAADLTIMEEAAELVRRVTTADRPLPQFTSCCPAWVKFCENRYPEFRKNISTCRSPQEMFGALLKEEARMNAAKEREEGREPGKTMVVSIMPCTAKKAEITRPEHFTDGEQNVDYVLTTTEITRMIQEAGIDLAQVQPEALDMPFGLSSGAGAIFGVTGGVTEAVLRRLINSSRAEDLEEISFSGIRGVDGIKEAKVNLNGREVKIAVVNGLHCAEDLLDKMKAGEVHYDFVEVMACKRGCIAGGGQPVPIGPRTKKARLEGIYKIDSMAQIKLSNENPIITEVYAGILKGKEHKLLHNEMNV